MKYIFFTLVILFFYSCANHKANKNVSFKILNYADSTELILFKLSIVKPKQFVLDTIGDFDANFEYIYTNCLEEKNTYFIVDYNKSYPIKIYFKDLTKDTINTFFIKEIPSVFLVQHDKDGTFIYTDSVALKLSNEFEKEKINHKRKILEKKQKINSTNLYRLK
jgi:hypothetical protein